MFLILAFDQTLLRMGLRVWIYLSCGSGWKHTAGGTLSESEGSTEKWVEQGQERDAQRN